MPTGLTSAWGYPIGAVAGNYKTMLDGDHPLTYELGMTSYPPSFAAGYFQSPLTAIATKNNVFTPQSAFGKQRNRKTKRSKRSKKSKRSKRSKKTNKKIPAKIKR